MDPGIARHVGARLLGGVEEESLESVCSIVLSTSPFLSSFMNSLAGYVTGYVCINKKMIMGEFEWSASAEP